MRTESLLVLMMLVPAGTGARASAAREVGETLSLGGVQCSVWDPAGGGPFPLVIFSHGFHGNRNQSTFLTAALSHAGYLVVAPNHKDAMAKGAGAPERPDQPFGRPDQWTEASFKDRADDVRAVRAALRSSPRFTGRIDWSRLALAGHSLGGYTVLGLAGAWPGWALPDVKAVLALSPYANAYLHHGDIKNVHCPVMYQTGTLDMGIAPFLLRPAGLWDKTGSPSYLVELQGAGHFAWTDLNPRFQQVITAYCVAFLDRYLKEDKAADPGRRRDGVADLRIK